jgi:hypothetical protein
MASKIDCFAGTVSRASGPIDTPTFKLGGKPVFISHLENPICKHCGQSMDFIGQIPLDKPINFSKRFKMAYIYMCPGKFDSRGWLECDTFQAFSGSNAVLLQEDLGQIIIPDIKPSIVDYSIKITPVQEPNIDTSDYENFHDLVVEVKMTTKIGGVPAWIQNNENPICPVCHKPLRFVAQIDSELDGPLPADPTHWSEYNTYNFGDAGMGYVFICENDCLENGAFLWQST